MAAAAASQSRPRTRTASTCAPEMARATHAFTISGYSLHRGIDAGNSIRSATFTVGGHDWCIRFCPDGLRQDHDDYATVLLQLVSEGAGGQQVRVSAEFRLVDQATGQSTLVGRLQEPKVFGASAWGRNLFNKSSELEASPYLRNDCLVIECDVTVVAKESRVVEETTATPAAIAPEFELQQLPPSELSENFGRLLEEKKGADVTFKVQGEEFHAHKIVLAARSPVFDAALYGPMADKTSQCSITVEDMHPDVFGALLHFIYTDSMMPGLDDFNNTDDDSKEMIKHLLVAADR